MKVATALLGLMLAATPAAAEQWISEPVALLQGLDKISARVSRFQAPVDKPVPFGDLSIVVRHCERSTPEERPENAAFLQIFEQRPDEKPVRIFSGWMFSSSPALSALEHPIYDVNVIECVPAAGSPSPAPAPSAPTGKTPE